MPSSAPARDRAFGLLALGVAMIVKRTAIAIPLVIALMLVPAMIVVDENLARKVQGWTPFAGFSIQHTVDRPTTTRHRGPASPSPPPTHSPHSPSVSP